MFVVTFPINPVIGPITIPTHLLFEMLGYYLGFWLYFKLKEKEDDPLTTQQRLFVIVGAIFGALIFSRLLGALEHPDLFFNPPSWLFYVSGKTIAGGLLGGIIGVEITKKILRIKQSSGDLFAYPLMLGIIIGRIGCLLTGVTDGTVGIASDLPWAFDQGDGISRHPTSLYEILFLGFVWFVIWLLEKRYTLKNGVRFKLFIAAYFGFRLLVEFIKPVTPIAFGLSAIQIASLIAVLFYSYKLFRGGLIFRGKTVHLL